ncbi:MAG: hypothetical protein DME62_14805 [Verrucomicrobia bacterium]|nr:MAG: hypothetical protein DME62_14805 [Verrucomicrobiota bacterium]
MKGDENLCLSRSFRNAEQDAILVLARERSLTSKKDQWYTTEQIAEAEQRLTRARRVVATVTRQF